MTDFSLDPTKFPQKLEIDIPPRVMDILEKKASATGRSIDELILELIDEGLGEYWQKDPGKCQGHALALTYCSSTLFSSKYAARLLSERPSLLLLVTILSKVE
jgi:hypothetical protein